MDTPFPEDLTRIVAALEKRGWTVGGLRSEENEATLGREEHPYTRHVIALGVAMHQPGRPSVSITLTASGLRRVDAVKDLARQAKEWAEATDVGRQIILYQREQHGLQEQASEIYKAVSGIEARVARLRIEDFLANIRDYLGGVRWVVATIGDANVVLMAPTISESAEVRIASRLGFGHHGGADVAPGITIRSDDGDVSLRASSFDVLLAFFQEHDLMGTLDLDHLDTLVVEAEERVQAATRNRNTILRLRAKV